MAEPRSRTEQAIQCKREAYMERVCKNPPILAPMWEREAEKLLTLPNPPDVGPGGEVACEQSTGHGIPRSYIRETLTQTATQIAEDASITRADLLRQRNIDALALAIDAADSINAANSLEKMLVHQMAVAHEASMRFMNKALSFGEGGRGMTNDESVTFSRMANTAARLMSADQAGLLTVQRLRTGGNQTVTVQHVNVQSGGQAVIGNVQPGGAGDGGNNVE